MRKIYAIIIMVTFFLLSFPSSLESSEISDYDDFVLVEDGDHCSTCEDDYKDDLNSAVYYFDYDERSIEPALFDIQKAIIENDASWLAGYNSVFSPN